MRKSLQVSMALVMLILFCAGCSSTKYPNTMTADLSAGVKTIGIVDEISTPTSLSVPGGNGAGGGLLGAVIAQAIYMQKQKSFTEKVRKQLDFQKFAENHLRESFTQTVKSHPGWTYVEPENLDKADAAFFLEITSMGIDNPNTVSNAFNEKYPPTITISVTLIGNPPFVIVRDDSEALTLDPASHPILYQRVECISLKDALKSYSLYAYAGNPEIFTSSFREAIDLAVKRIVHSWGNAGAPK